MRKVLILTNVFSFTVGSAFGFVVEKKAEQLFFLDHTCESAYSSVLALQTWSKNIGEQKNCDPSPVKGEDGCRYDITQCVPEHVLKYEGSYSPQDGPNCWNTALVLSKILPHLRYAAPEEMSFYMRPPLCRELLNGEERKPGDVGAIREIKKNGTLEMHGFIYLSDTLAFSKNEFKKEVPYRLMELNQVYADFKVPTDSQCRQNQIDLESKCGQAVAYFRCQSFSDYLYSTEDIPFKLKKAVHDVTQFEDCFEKTNMANETLSDEALTHIVSVSEALVTYLESEKHNLLKSGLKSKEQEFVLGNLQWRLFSLSEQLGMTSNIKEGQELLDFSLQLQKQLRQIKN